MNFTLSKQHNQFLTFNTASMSILAFQMPEKVVMEKADDFHGLFEFKPLEKGYGVTIGNALLGPKISSLNFLEILLFGPVYLAILFNLL